MPTILEPIKNFVLKCYLKQIAFSSFSTQRRGGGDDSIRAIYTETNKMECNVSHRNFNLKQLKSVTKFLLSQLFCFEQASSIIFRNYRDKFS